MGTSKAYIGLGTNLGDRVRNLEEVVGKLKTMPDTWFNALSCIYETSPIGFEGPSFLNAVVVIETLLRPRKLLDELLAIETAMGRTRDPESTASRIIDLDLLIYGEEIAEEKGLVLPHPRMLDRRFVMEPLAELSPDLHIDPIGATAAEIAAELSESSPEQKVRRLGTLEEVKTNYGLRIEN